MAVKKVSALAKGNASKAEKGKIKLLVAIVGQTDEKKIVEILNRGSVAIAYSFEGVGTARSAVLDYLGLGETKKRIVLGLFPETNEKSLLERIQNETSLYLVGKGICFTMPLTGISTIVEKGLLRGVDGQRTDGNKEKRSEKMGTERKYDLIVAAVQAGYAEEAMEAARTAGAAGGTLLHATTLENRKAEQLIGIKLQKETEILLILTRHEGKLPIMHAVQESAGLKTDGGGILFSMPVDDLVGVGLPTVPDEPTEKKEK